MQYISSGSEEKEPLLHFLASTKDLAADLSDGHVYFFAILVLPK